MNQPTTLLIIGKQNGILHWYENVIDALSEMEGIRVLTYPINHSSTLDNITRKTLKWISSDALDSLLRKRLETILLRERPDLVLFVDLVDYPDYVLEVIREHKANLATAFWIGDLFDASLTKWKGLIDLFLLTDTYFIEQARQMGIDNTRHLPLAYNDRIFGNRVPLEKRIDKMLFIGAYSENRRSLLSRLDDPMVVMGKRWKSSALPHHHVIDKRIGIDKVAEYYNAYQCILNIKNSDNVVNGVNMRTFDATACGNILFNDALDDLSLYFDTQNDLVMYRDVDELNFLYRDYRSRPEKYSRIAENGHRRCILNHSYRHRMKTLLDWLG